MPHRGIHHQGGGQPLIVPGKCTNAAAQFIPGLGVPPDALPNQKFEGEHPGMQLLHPVLVLFVNQAFALGHQQLIFGGEPAVPSEAFDVFAHPFIRTLRAGMALVTPLEKLQGDVGTRVMVKGDRDDGKWMVWTGGGGDEKARRRHPRRDASKSLCRMQGSAHLEPNAFGHFTKNKLRDAAEPHALKTLVVFVGVVGSVAVGVGS